MKTRGRFRRPRWFLPFTLIVLLTLLGSSAGAYQLNHLPGVDQRLPANSAPLFVTLTQPASGSTYPANATIPVWAKGVAARPVAALELWADGRRVERKEVEAGSTALQLAAFWSWQPAREGEHTLLARVIDATGAVAQSVPVRLRATAPAGMRILVTATGGESTSALAEAYGVSEQDILDGSPELDGAAPLSPGRQVFIPVPPPALPEPEPTAPPPALWPRKVVVDSPPGKLDLWLQSINLPAGSPAAPGLTVMAGGCDARLVISGTADARGYFVYRLAPDDTGFERIATLPGGAGLLEYTDAGLGGHVEYYVSSFNAAGESPGNVAAVDLDAGCVSPHWGLVQAGLSDLWLQEGKLVVSGGVDRVYYYLTLDGKNYGRVPAEPDSFVSPMSREELLAWTGAGPEPGDSVLADELLSGTRRAFDLAAVAGQAWGDGGQHTMSLEAWGWGGSGLVRLGEFSDVLATREQMGLADVPVASVSSTQLYVCGAGGCSGEMAQLTEEASVSWDENDDASRDFIWYCETSDWTGFVWQVSRQPFAAYFDPSPPGLVASGATEQTYLQLNFHHLVPPSFAKEKAGPVQVHLTPEAPGVETSGGLQAAKSTPGLPLAEVFGAPQFSLAADAATEAKLPCTYYVRVTPTKGNQKASWPSNTVVVHYGPLEEGPDMAPVPVPPSIYEVEIVGFEPVVWEDATVWGCVQIVQNDRYTGALDATNPDIWTMIPVGAVVCPDIYKGMGSPSWYEALWDFLKGAVDWLAQAYEYVKSTIVDAVASVIPFCGDTCKTLLMTGLNAALVAVGLPPSLPSFAQLEEMGQAYVVSFLAQQAGPDCTEGSLCYEAIEKGIDTIKEAASAGGTNTACGDEELAHQHGREPMCLPPGVVGQPYKGSEPVPATVQVRITRRPEPADVAESDLNSYRLHLSTWAVNDSMVGDSILLPINTYMQDGVYIDAKTEGYLFTIEEPLEAPLFKSVELPVLRLSPGESIVVPVQLDKLDYWIPGHAEKIHDVGGYVHYNDWPQLYFDGKLTIDASIDCYTTFGWQNCGASPNNSDEMQVDLPSNYW